MSINERIRYVRKKVLKLNQTDFAKLIGMKQTSVSSFEKIGATVTEQTLKSICLAIPNLNENWLRNGVEPMYIQSQKFSLDEFVKQHNMTELELEILKVYLELDPDVRDTIVEHFKSHLYNSTKFSKSESVKVEVPEKKPILKTTKSPSNPVEKTVLYKPMTEAEIDDLVEDYRRQLETEKKQKEKLLVLQNESSKETKRISNL